VKFRLNLLQKQTTREEMTTTSDNTEKEIKRHINCKRKVVFTQISTPVSRTIICTEDKRKSIL
jgi:hypothetical protein